LPADFFAGRGRGEAPSRAAGPRRARVNGGSDRGRPAGAPSRAARPRLSRVNGGSNRGSLKVAAGRPARRAALPDPGARGSTAGVTVAHLRWRPARRAALPGPGCRG
jgi:hypothetical protein